MFSWAERRRRIDTNPCRGVHQPEPAKARERVLSNDELRWFWQACDAADAGNIPGAVRPFAPILRLLVLTGQRLGEVSGMRWDELSADGALWSLPGRRTKNGKPHQVPLSGMAQAIIAGVKRKHDLVFTTKGKTPPSGWSRAKSRVDAAMLAIARQERGPDVVIEPFVVHDIRRSVVTGLVELNVPPHLVELIVNHVSGAKSGVAGTYNRSEMLPERRAALERWAAHVGGLLSGSSNIVTLRPGGAA
jgi:integrase